MKEQLTKLALTAALGLAITFTFTACGKGGGDVKLLETITDESGNVQKRFEYDKQNRIVKIDNDTITYADNLITVGTQKYVINGNTVTVDGSSFTIDKDGYFVKREGEGWALTLEYRDGNLIKRSIKGELPSVDVMDKYDDKKSPFFNCNSPKWLLYELRILDSYITFISKNNVLEMNTQGDNNITRVYKYEYDGDGFPTKLTKEETDEDNTTRTITRFTYRGEPQNAPAKTETAATESQPSGGKECGKEGPPITTETVFLGTNEDSEGRAPDIFRLPNGEQIAMDGYASEAAFILPSGKQIELNGSMPNDVKECDKVSITYKMGEIFTAENDGSCEKINSLVSVKKIGSGVKLLESATDDEGRVHKFEYDKQNRIVKMDDITITYAANLITVGTQKYAINGNTVTVDGKSLTLNKDGYIAKVGDDKTFKYKNGNLTKNEYPNPADDVPPTYVVSMDKYDDKKSPLSNCETPKWLLQELHILGSYHISKNNILEKTLQGRGTTTSVYKYEYDSDGFPEQVEEAEKYGDDSPTITTTRYTYRCGT